MQDPQTGSFDAGRKILPTQWPARFPINQSSGSPRPGGAWPPRSEL